MDTQCTYQRPRLRLSHLAISLACASAFGCRPEGYVPPAKTAEEAPPEERLNDAELSHQALFGVDAAPATFLTPPKEAELHPSGISSLVVRNGTGERTPRKGETVVIHFTGWNEQGERFDSSRQRGKPDRYRIDQLVPGWREGVQMMVVGEKRRLWVPERLAFGPVPSPGRPSGDIVLEVELLELLDAPEAPKVPDDLLEPPKEARATPSGLRSVVLEPGKGKDKPESGDRVLVHYSGWTQAGQMFDSSVMRGNPISFGLDEVIPGWSEAVKLMVEGEKRRVWIPASLAYGDKADRPGLPSGPLVFDIELIEIQR